MDFHNLRTARTSWSYVLHGASRYFGGWWVSLSQAIVSSRPCVRRAVALSSRIVCRLCPISFNLSSSGGGCSFSFYDKRRSLGTPMLSVEWKRCQSSIFEVSAACNGREVELPAQWARNTLVMYRSELEWHRSDIAVKQPRNRIQFEITSE